MERSIAYVPLQDQNLVVRLKDFQKDGWIDFKQKP